MTSLIGTWTVDRYSASAFLRGAASTFNLRGNTTREYRMWSSGESADRHALLDDWRVVGRDLAGAIAIGDADSSSDR